MGDTKDLFKCRRRLNLQLEIFRIAHDLVLSPVITTVGRYDV